jgi:hypothetical protein
MKIRFSPSSRPQPRKNDAVISFITNDLTSANSLPTPQNSLRTGAGGLGGGEEVKRP